MAQNRNSKQQKIEKTTQNKVSRNLDNKNDDRSLLYYQIWTFLVLFVSYASYTYNRKSASYVAPTLLASGLLTKSTSGAIISCQNTAYAISKFIGGILSDKLSAKLLLSAGLGLSGIATLLFPTTTSSTTWAALWFLNGFAQGAGWPSCSKLLKKWYSPKYFGTLWSLLTGSSNASGTLCPFVSTYILLNYGWETSMQVAGTISLGMAGISLLALVDDPMAINLPDPNASVVNNKETKSSEKSSTKSSSMSVSDLLKSPLLWVVSFAYLLVFGCKTVLTDWGTVYLMEKLGRTQLQASSFTSAIETGGFIGNIIAGLVTDKLSSKIKIQGNPRLLISMVFLSTCAAALHCLIFFINTTTPQYICSLLGAVLGASIFGPICIFGIVASESYPSHLSGTAHAVVALAANVGAIMAGYPVSRVIQIYNWYVVFAIFEVGMILSIIAIFGTRKFHLINKKLN